MGYMRSVVWITILLIGGNAIAQKTKRSEQPFSAKMVVLPTVETLEQLTDITAVAVVTDSVRGGLFRYSEDTLVNQGTTFRAKALGKGSWMRIFDPIGGIRVSWFGAIANGRDNAAPAIQAAIDEAVKLKSQVLFSAGVYFIPADVSLSLPANSFLKGVNMNATQITTDSVYSDAAPALIKSFGDNIHLEDIGFSGGRPIAPDQRSVSQKGRYSILNISFDIEKANDIVIKRCAFQDAFGRAVLYRASNITISDCEFRRIGRYNVDFAALDGAISNFARDKCSNVIIENNRFENIGTHCLSSYKVEFLQIKNNVLKNISGIGIANQECGHVEITANTLQNTGDNGIDLQRCSQVVISHNFFENAGDKHAGGAGSAAAIFFGDDYGYGKADNTVISNNFIKGTFVYSPQKDMAKAYQNCGIYLIDASHIKVVNNSIQQIGVPEYTSNHSLSLEDGNGIMIINTAKGQSSDILVEGNTLTEVKTNAIYINGQSREIKVKNNYISTFGTNGIFMRAIGTNLYSQLSGNTIIDGKNIFRNKVAADIYIDAQNAWITNFSITDNQMRNNKRSNYQTRYDTVFTTHGIYFTADGFGKFNNLIVANNQLHGHMVDEIGFSDAISEYSVVKDKYFPLVSFNNNYAGSTDDNPHVIIPGYNQAKKPRIISESYDNKVPDYGNYSAGSIIRNIYPTSGVYGWVAVTSGFAAAKKWQPLQNYQAGETVYVDSDVFRCIKAGSSGKLAPKAGDKAIPDNEVEWEYMGKRALFKKMTLQELR